VEESTTEEMTLYQARSEAVRLGVRFRQSAHSGEGLVATFGADGIKYADHYSDDALFYEKVLKGLGREVFVVPALDSDQYGQRTDGACPMCVSLNTDYGTKFNHAYRYEPVQVAEDEWEYPAGIDPEYPYKHFDTPRGACLDCRFEWVPQKALDGSFSGYNTVEVEWQVSRAEWLYYESEGNVDDGI